MTIEKTISGQFRLTFHDAVKSRVALTVAREQAIMIEGLSLAVGWVVVGAVYWWNVSSPLFLVVDEYQNPDRLLFPTLFFVLLILAYYLYRRRVIRRGENFDDYRVSEIKFTFDNSGFHYEQVTAMQWIVTDLPCSRIVRIWEMPNHLVIIDDVDREYIIKKSSIDVGSVETFRSMFNHLGPEYIVVRTWRSVWSRSSNQ